MPRSRSKSKTSLSPGDLPQNIETWYVLVRQIDLVTELKDGSSVQPYLFLLTDQTNDLILQVDLAASEPDAETVKDKLFQAMTNPAPSAGVKPHRPQQVQFEKETLFTAVSPSLWEIGVSTSRGKAPEMVEDVIEEMIETIGGESSAPMGLLSVEGVTPRQVADLFAAAAQFHHAAPWKHLEDVQVIAAHIDPPGIDRYVQFMGHGGMEFGLVLYADWEGVLHIFKHANNPLENLPEAGFHSLTFESLDYLPPEDVEGIRKYGWKAAARKVYPLPMIYHEDGFERPDRQELLVYEALLRTLPDFVSNSLKDDGQGDYAPAEATLSAQTHDGPTSVTLRYPAGEIPEWYFEDDDEWDEAPLEAVIELDENLQQANDLAHQAWQDSDPEKRVHLAEQALELSPDCTEAYLVLADEAEEVEDSLELCVKGVQAGERILGADFLEANQGHLWAIRQARPYLYIRHMLADNLALLGQEEEALEHCLALLRFNPNDHQAVRYDALNLMLRLGLDEQAMELIDDYDDESTTWFYTHALLAFRQQGNNKHSRAILKEALAYNPHVAAYLAAEKPIPAEPPESIGDGDESDAMYYVVNNYIHWYRTPGAVDWLKKYAR